MPSLTGNYNVVHASGASGVISESIALLSALSTTTALASKNFLVPTWDSRTQVKDPSFIGAVSGVTASMVKTSDNSTVQSQLLTLTSDVADLVAETSALKTQLATQANKTHIF